MVENGKFTSYVTSERSLYSTMNTYFPRSLLNHDNKHKELWYLVVNEIIYDNNNVRSLGFKLYLTFQSLIKF